MLIRYGGREKLLTYMWKLRLGVLLVPSISLLKAMVLWGWQLKELMDPPVSFLQGFISALPPASFQIPSLPSVFSILRHDTTFRVKFLKLLVGGTGDNAENFAWCVLRQVFKRENASKTLCQKSAHFPNWHCLLLLATQEFMHVLWVRCPQSSRGGWDITPWSAVLRKQVSKIQMLLCLWNKVHQTYCQLFMLKSTLPLMLMVLWSINPC